MRKVWAIVNQFIPWRFPSYGVRLTSQMIKSVDINKPVDIKFHRGIFYLPIIYHNLIYSTELRRLCYSKKRDAVNVNLVTYKELWFNNLVMVNNLWINKLKSICSK